MQCIKIIFLSFLILCFNCNISFAEAVIPHAGMSEDPEIFMPYGLNDREIIVDYPAGSALEPNIIVVKYLNSEPPKNLAERVDRMVQGITIDLPPEYDVFGYEMRRYMQAVGNPKIYTDNEFLREQRLNIKKANIVLDFWRKQLKKELEEIEVLVEAPDVSFATRTAFKQNSVVARNFLSVSQSWVLSNMEFTQFLDSMEGRYEINYPQIKFTVPEQGDKFLRLLKKRQNAVIELRKYTIFRLMIY